MRRTAAIKLQTACSRPGPPDARAAAVAEELEGHLHTAHGGVNDRYRAQLRMLLLNLPNVREVLAPPSPPPACPTDSGHS